LAIYELAYHLKLPIYKMIDEMPYEELLGWMNYFERRPVDWRDDDRTFKLLQVQGFKGRPETIFTSLAALNKTRIVSIDGKVNIDELKRSALFQQMLSSVGGDKLNYD
jgi:hypothetical protein